MTLEEAGRLVQQARSIVALTGAGISAESGVPTFRGPDGLWKRYRPEELATPEAFARDPKLVWEWYDWRRQKVAAAHPNPGHAALVEIEKRAPGFTLVTQNVDGLHPLAGSKNVLELHGSLWRTRCRSCGETRENREVPLPEIPPSCACGGMLRPDIVWFGESLPEEVLAGAFRAVEACDLAIVIGTSGVVYPAAAMGERAVARGVPVIEINPQPTPLSAACACFLEGKAGELLPRLLA